MYLYTDQTYSEVDFSHKDLREGELRGCTFTKCRFRGTRMEEVLTSGSQFIDCDFFPARP